MKERPILMSAPMVQAILDGRKTQTRRVWKSRYGRFDDQPCMARCPYGVVGDKLWVRETFQHAPGGGYWYRAEDRGNHIKTPWKPSMFMPRDASRITLKITDIRIDRLHNISEADAWAEGIGQVDRPLEALFNIFMQFPSLDIGELTLSMPDDFAFGSDAKVPTDHERIIWASARGVFAVLWEAINGPGSWQKNPLVWAINFNPTT